MFQQSCRAAAFAIAVFAASALPAHAQTAPLNYVKGAIAYTTFDNSGSDLTGPPGTTPPGIRAEAKDVTTLGLAFGRKLTDQWSIELAVGVPPKAKVYGAGTGAALGEVGTVKVYSPALVVNYTFTDLSPHVRPYVGAGVNYTWFNGGQISPAYTAAFGGTSTSSHLDSSWGGVLKLGAEFPIDRNWFVDVAVQHYWMRTTATLVTDTPGFGPIARRIDQTLDPNIYAVAIGYRF